MGERNRQRQVGYIAAQRIDNALMAIEEIIRDARHLLNNQTSVETRYSKIAHILEQAYQGREQLKEINQLKPESPPFAAESFQRTK